MQGFHEGLEDDCEDQIQEEELPYDDYQEAKEGSDYGEIDIHHVDHLLRKGIASDHLEHGQQGGPQIVKVNDAIAQVVSLLKVIG